jgi:hypothetical protein
MTKQLFIFIGGLAWLRIAFEAAVSDMNRLFVVGLACAALCAIALLMDIPCGCQRTPGAHFRPVRAFDDGRLLVQCVCCQKYETRGPKPDPPPAPPSPKGRAA